MDRRRKKGMKEKQEVKKSKLREWIESIIWAFIIAMFIRTFFIQAFKIPTGSMEDSLLIGDFLLANKMVYGVHIPFIKKRILKFRNPKRGEIVIFLYPYARKYFVKRCIALAKDTVEVKHKVVYVNGKSLYEPYVIHRDPREFPPLPTVDPATYQKEWERAAFLSPSVDGYCRDNFGPVIVPDGCIFVMGDNRDNSDDSRFWGPLNMEYLIGKPLILYWSWDKDIPIYKFWEKIRWRRILNFVF